MGGFYDLQDRRTKTGGFNVFGDEDRRLRVYDILALKIVGEEGFSIFGAETV